MYNALWPALWNRKCTGSEHHPNSERAFVQLISRLQNGRWKAFDSGREDTRGVGISSKRQSADMGVNCYENTMSAVACLHHVSILVETLQVSPCQNWSFPSVTVTLRAAGFIWNIRCLQCRCAPFPFYSWGLAETCCSCLLRLVSSETSH